MRTSTSFSATSYAYRIARVRRAVSRPPEEDDGMEAHTPEHDAAIRALLQSARLLVQELKSDADPATLGRVVAHYVARAIDVGFSRTRIRDAIKLLVHDHAAPRWAARAATISSLAMRTPPGSEPGAPHRHHHDRSYTP